MSARMQSCLLYIPTLATRKPGRTQHAVTGTRLVTLLYLPTLYRTLPAVQYILLCSIYGLQFWPWAPDAVQSLANHLRPCTMHTHTPHVLANGSFNNFPPPPDIFLPNSYIRYIINPTVRYGNCMLAREMSLPMHVRVLELVVESSKFQKAKSKAKKTKKKETPLKTCTLLFSSVGWYVYRANTFCRHGEYSTVPTAL